MDDIVILGLAVPDAGPVFLAALAVHVVAGSTCVACGAIAALAVKGGRQHHVFGRIYLWGISILFLTLSVMSVIRWRENAHLLAVGTLTVAAAWTGYLNRRHHRSLHIAGMGLSYIGLLTGFYIDNGHRLPLWSQLPAWTYWTLPALIGAPLIIRSLRCHATARRTRATFAFRKQRHRRPG